MFLEGIWKLLCFKGVLSSWLIFIILIYCFSLSACSFNNFYTPPRMTLWGQALDYEYFSMNAVKFYNTGYQCKIQVTDSFNAKISVLSLKKWHWLVQSVFSFHFIKPQQPWAESSCSCVRWAAAETANILLYPNWNLYNNHSNRTKFKIKAEESWGLWSLASQTGENKITKIIDMGEMKPTVI